MKKLKHFITYYLFQWPRILIYRHILSDFKGLKQGRLSGVSQPLLLRGEGNLKISKNVKFGYKKSQAFYSGSSYIEVRTPQGYINIGPDVHFNNSCTLISVRDGIEIGKNCVFGVGCTIIDNDFHAIHNQEKTKGAPVKIGNNVFVGSNVHILKGVEIADNCTIGMGAIVARSFKTACVIAGNPAQKVRDIETDND